MFYKVYFVVDSMLFICFQSTYYLAENRYTNAEQHMSNDNIIDVSHSVYFTPPKVNWFRIVY